MAGVYNRKLFRQASARDELRKIGGIMASSEDLLMEALRTAEQAPRSAALGPMAMPSQAPAPMPMAQPMMAPMQQPMMQPAFMPPMQQPMMAPAPMPMDQMQQPMMQPAFMPPMMPQSAQPMQQPMMQQPMQPAAPQGFAGGGFVLLPGTLESPVDITKQAGTAVEAPSVDLDESALATAEDLAGRVDSEDPEAIGAEIVDAAAQRGAEISGNMQADLAAIYQTLTGDPAAYEKNIDALNRGIIGAAIGAGTSARATENISKGMLVGLEAAKETEERRVRDARALQLAQLQARAKGAGGVGSRDYRNPVDAYQDAYQSVMNAGEFDLQIPEGMTREEYADQVATALIARSYSPEQLVGTPFEGVAGTGRTAPAAGGQGLTPEQQAVLGQARDAIAEGRDPVGVAAKLREMGIDPGLL